MGVEFEVSAILDALADMCHCCAYILKTNFLMAGPQCFMDCTVFIVVRK